MKKLVNDKFGKPKPSPMRWGFIEAGFQSETGKPTVGQLEKIGYPIARHPPESDDVSFVIGPGVFR